MVDTRILLWIIKIISDILPKVLLALTGFKNHDIAISLCIATLIIVFLIFSKDLRRSTKDIILLIFSKHLVNVIFVIVFYTLFSIYLLSVFDFWDLSFLKNTIVWFFSICVLVFKITNVKDATIYKSIIKDTLKWSVFISFLFHLYSFRLTFEIILVIALLVFSAFYAYCKVKKEHKEIEKFSLKMINIIGWSYIVLTAYNLIRYPEELLSIHSGKEILIPIVLTIVFLPIYHGLLLWVNYSTIFHCINYTSKDKTKQRELKLYVVKSSLFYIDRIVRIRKKIRWFKEATIEEIETYATPFHFDKLQLSQSYEDVVGNFVDAKIELYVPEVVDPVSESKGEEILRKDKRSKYFIEPLQMNGLNATVLLVFDLENKLDSASIYFDTFPSKTRSFNKSIKRKDSRKIILHYEDQYGVARVESDEGKVSWSWLKNGIKISVEIEMSNNNVNGSIESIAVHKVYWKLPTLDLLD